MSDAPKADQDRVISQPLVPEKKARRKNGAIKTSKGPSERDLARRAAHFAALARDPIGGAPKRVVERERRLPWSVAAIDRTMFNSSRQIIIQRATANDFRWPCCIYGEVGRGKTYLAAAIYMDWPGPAVWFTYTEFCRHVAQLKSTGELHFSTNDGASYEFSLDSWWEYLTNAGLVVIDDIGVGKLEEARNEALWEILERRRHKPLILTSNLSPDNTDKESLYGHFDTRVLSRIQGGECIQLGGYDLRASGGVRIEA